MVDVMRTPVSGRALAALGRGDGTSPMLVASVTAWRREADGAAARPRSGLEAGPGAAQTRQGASRAREIVASTIYPTSAETPMIEVGIRNRAAVNTARRRGLFAPSTCSCHIAFNARM